MAELRPMKPERADWRFERANLGLRVPIRSLRGLIRCLRRLIES